MLCAGKIVFMILPVTTTFTMPTGLEKLEFTVEYKNKQGKVRRSFYDIDQKFFRHFISGTYQEEGTKKLAEILQSPAVFHSYRISSFLIFSSRSSKVPDLEVEGPKLEFTNPDLERLLEDLGYDPDEDVVLDKGEYWIDQRIFADINIKGLYALLASGCVSEILIELAEQ